MGRGWCRRISVVTAVRNRASCQGRRWTLTHSSSCPSSGRIALSTYITLRSTEPDSSRPHAKQTASGGPKSDDPVPHSGPRTHLQPSHVSGRNDQSGDGGNDRGGDETDNLQCQLFLSDLFIPDSAATCSGHGSDKLNISCGSCSRTTPGCASTPNSNIRRKNLSVTSGGPGSRVENP